MTKESHHWTVQEIRSLSYAELKAIVKSTNPQGRYADLLDAAKQEIKRRKATLV